jgi:hypothetical protein
MRLIERLSAFSARSWRFWNTKQIRAALSAVVLMIAVSSTHAAAQGTTNEPMLHVSSSEIVERMVQQNALRAEHLKYFTSRRHYHVEFNGLGRSLSADMHAQVTYSAEAGKTFQIIDESGSHLLLNHVLKRLLQTEQDDSHQRTASLTPSNYTFIFQTGVNENGRQLYVFAVEPKVKNKLLYRGKIWIDAKDYAVVRVEAEPAENPSFWIKKTEIQHVYAKSGEFWLPQRNLSKSNVRLGGTAVLSIDYGTYQFEKPALSLSSRGN